MPEMDYTPGRAAFEAYKEKRQGFGYDGKPIPEWKDINPGVQEGWEAAALAVIQYHEFKQSIIKAHTKRSAHAQDKRQSKPL